VNLSPGEERGHPGRIATSPDDPCATCLASPDV
jgi:hypothetical protein